MAKDLISNWQQRAIENQKQYKRLLKTADKQKLLRQLPAIHEKVIAETNCLNCAACCKNYSPRFKTTDIKRISKHLKLKEGVFIEKYLRLDDEGDYVTKGSPCSFLGADNYCSIYEVRPGDCKRFPYTDEDVIFKRVAITLKNVSFCPIVFKVMETLLKVEKNQGR